MLTWFEVVEVLAVSVFGPVSYSPSNELWDDAEAVPVLDSRFNWIWRMWSVRLIREWWWYFVFSFQFAKDLVEFCVQF